ncbi:MAG TPA: aminotransferase class IV [Bacteroidales bacterium]|nr:aminotransferase class IV [Bacteroidales bacterium]
MTECYGKKFIMNGDLYPANHFDNSMVYSGNSVYEVIRMVMGKPVFFHDHMERLATSASLQRKRRLADEETLKKDILRLTRADRKKIANLKIVFNYRKEENNYLVYFIEPIYPTENQYVNGVKGILYYAERKEPESKVINHKLRSSIYHKLILEGGYEAILVNEKDEITEGSRSNIFFLQHDRLVTAPDNCVLNGITRKHILDICKEHGIPVEKRCAGLNELSDFDAVFMTGTSPVVLPFCCIGDNQFKTNLFILEKLRKLYMARAEDSIGQFRH